MMIVVPSKRSCIATCLYQKPAGNGITDRRKKINGVRDNSVKLPDN
jgi:hypothetical protein